MQSTIVEWQQADCKLNMTFSLRGCMFQPIEYNLCVSYCTTLTFFFVFFSFASRQQMVSIYLSEAVMKLQQT